MCLAVVCAAGLCATGEATTTREERELTLLRLRFAAHPSPHDDKREAGPYDITLFCRDGVPNGGYRANVVGQEGAEADRDVPTRGGGGRAETQIPRALFPEPVWAEGLKREGDLLTGTLGIGFFPGRPATYRIEAHLGDRKVAGTFAPTATKHQGRLTGTVYAGVALDALKKQEALAAGADWPNWKGPNHDCRAVAPKGAMVDHWKFARLAWVSEARLAGGGGGAGHPNPVSTRTDYNGPLVADGRVVYATTERSAPSPDWPGFFERYAGLRRGTLQRERYEKEPGYRRWVKHGSAIILDDVVYCMDAASGATLWKTVLTERGTSGNLTGKGKGGLWSTGVIADGRFYFMGESGWLYCLDAATGKVVWDSREANPQRVAAFENNLARLKRGEIKLPLDDPTRAGRGSMASLVAREFGGVYQTQASLALIGGTLVCPSGGAADGRGWGTQALVGIDPHTGTRLWGPVKDVKFGHWTPAKWIHDGREYAVTGRACLEPATGNVLWTLDAKTESTADGVVVGATLVIPGTRQGDPTCAYRLTPTRAERIWQIDPATKSAPWYVTMAADAGRGIVAYKAGHSEAFVIDVETGKVLDHKYIGNKLWGGNAIMGDRLIDAQTRMCRITDVGKLEYLGSLYGIRFTCTTPALADGRIFVRAPYGIVCYDLRKSK
jgi:outer membrane protein assembly factor BamB